MHHLSRNGFVSLLLLGSSFGCRSSVMNLGGPAADEWFAGTTADGGQDAGPTSIYHGIWIPLSYAVDETTLFISLQYAAGQQNMVRIKACALSSCAPTVRTLYEQSFASVGGDFTELVVDGGDLFFTTYENGDPSTANPFIVTCPVTGCAGGLRRLGQGEGQPRLAVDSDFAYWTVSIPPTLFRCARVGCLQAESRDLKKDMHDDAALSDGLAFVLAGDFAYMTTKYTVQRIRRDLSEEAELLYASEIPLSGIGVSGDRVYFGISTLTGQILRCPVTGCVGDPEVISSGQRWPTSLQVDQRTAYWLDLGNRDSPVRATLVAAPLDGSFAGKTLIDDIDLYTGARLVMNSHHVYWLNYSFDVDNDYALRTLPK